MMRGDVVRIREPMPDEDAAQRYAVAEMRGDRVLVVALDTGLSIAPQNVFLVSDLERTA